ncbi:uncharacterized protein LOC133321932 [Musca vetustissima]|uniref:uncharacterized protein LOC133321932 n=1 Tax=Musca vetustissima TaxID=27455 RepID=UPI002AB64E8E|nr:uncharacterized protein LOC133321932 [Musca vetustissima]
MLKWAVNGPRHTYMQSTEHLNLEPMMMEPNSGLSQAQRRRLKRKSSDVGSLRSRTSWHDKENQYTSTPLHPTSRSFNDSPSRKLDSLKDLSNILAEPLAFHSPKRLSLHKSSPSLLKTPEPQSQPLRSAMPANYASTLPTFDVEYSPCSLIPGPILALRGVGIPDSYFEKPRYITPQTQAKPHKYPHYLEESSLSSSKMGDTTLERMIDAILESNRKQERKQQKQHKHHATNMSPSYTPADDPASDLQEVWDSEKARYRQKEQQFRSKLTKKCLFNEREICSPEPACQETPAPQEIQPFQEPQQQQLSGLLRRQRGVRRKRKLEQFKASVINSAHKLLAELIHDEVHPQKMMRNVSPDSGHNSSSEYEEEGENEDSTLEADNKTLDATKRRLSFSLNKLNEN